MGARPSDELKRAVDLIINKDATPYQAAKAVGIHQSTLTRSKYFKEQQAAKAKREAGKK